jgi:pimeloyl-ACP methyl ester carboxylesterase
LTAFVLIHGGGTTGRFWDRLLDHLPGPALAPDLPGRGAHPRPIAELTVDGGSASVLEDIKAWDVDDELVVIAHSSGGLFTPGVVVGLDGRVRAVVLNAASVPTEGGGGIECMKQRHREGLEIARQIARDSGQTIDTGQPKTDPEAYREAYGGPPLTDDDCAFVADPARAVTDSVDVYFQPVHWSLVDVPITYLVNDHDRPTPPELQLEMAGRLPAPPAIIHLDSGHVPAVTMPDVLASHITAIAGSPWPV